MDALKRGHSVKKIHPKLKLYLQCCPTLNLNLRFLPRAGGYLEQDFETWQYFEIIETRLKSMINSEQTK